MRKIWIRKIWMRKHLSWVFQEASVIRIRAGADDSFRGEDKCCRAAEGGREETSRTKEGEHEKRFKILTSLSFEERRMTFLIPQVLEKSVSMMESFQGGEEVRQLKKYGINLGPLIAYNVGPTL